MKKYLIPTALLLVTALSSCTKTINEDLSGNEHSLLELRVEGQMGTAIIDRDGSRATATVYILETPGFAYDRVPVKGIVVSEGASASVGNGDVLNFSNPERRARITVTSRSGHRLDWWIYLETYDPFFLGTWRIVDVKLACNQRVSGVGDGAWTTQLSSGEFGTYGLPEYDDRVTITLGEISDNELTGTLVHSAGDDGAYGNFWGVYAPYSGSPAGHEPASASPASAGRIAVDPRPDHQPDEDHAEQRLLDHDLRHGRQQPAFPLPAAQRRRRTGTRLVLRQHVAQFDGTLLRHV